MSIFRAIFGPSKEEIWRQFCDQTGSNFVPGSFFKFDKVEATHGPWVVTLDTYAVSTGKSTIDYTRMRAPYVNPDGFRFTVYRKGIFTPIGKLFGMQDVSVGHEDFDHEFVIKGNDDNKLWRLFASQRVRDLISSRRTFTFP